VRLESILSGLSTGRSNMAHVYIKVTKDKYRLPIAVADSVPELSRLTGNAISTIYTMISKGIGLFEKVDIGDLEEEE
jgi:hypothetical protein